MSITKCRDFAKQMSQNLVLVFHRKHFGATDLLNSMTPKQLLESKLVKLSQTETQFGDSEIARVSLRVELGHTDLQVLVRPKVTSAMA